MSDTTERKQGLVDLLTRIGDDKIELQNLDSSLTNARVYGKRGQQMTVLTFGTHSTSPGAILNGDGRLGLVLWLDRSDVEAARAAFKAEAPIPFVSCECPAGRGEPCPCTADECNAREAERRASRG